MSDSSTLALHERENAYAFYAATVWWPRVGQDSTRSRAKTSLCKYRWVSKNGPTAALDVLLGIPITFTSWQRLRPRPEVIFSEVSACGLLEF
jgi:hypothetical protein